MKNSLRRIERYLACQIAQVSLQPIAADYIERWKLNRQRKQPLPPPEELIDSAAAARIPTLAPGPLIDYLCKCADNNDTPEPNRIIEAIVHGYARDFLKADRTCRCPARKPLYASHRIRPINPLP